MSDQKEWRARVGDFLVAFASHHGADAPRLLREYADQLQWWMEAATGRGTGKVATFAAETVRPKPSP